MAASTPPASGAARKPTSTTTWRFAGHYPCAYLLPGRVSAFVDPGQEVDWPEGPPDSNWEPAAQAAPAKDAKE